MHGDVAYRVRKESKQQSESLQSFHLHEGQINLGGGSPQGHCVAG